jgi:hypothetical protein
VARTWTACGVPAGAATVTGFHERQQAVLFTPHQRPWGTAALARSRSSTRQPRGRARRCRLNTGELRAASPGTCRPRCNLSPRRWRRGRRRRFWCSTREVRGRQASGDHPAGRGGTHCTEARPSRAVSYQYTARWTIWNVMAPRKSLRSTPACVECRAPCSFGGVPCPSPGHPRVGSSAPSQARYDALLLGAETEVRGAQRYAFRCNQPWSNRTGGGKMRTDFD